MSRKSSLLALFVVVSALFLASCDILGLGKPEDNDATVEISAVGWVIETIHPSYWESSDSSTPTCFIRLWIYCDGSFQDADVEGVRVVLPNGATWWSLDEDFNETDGCFGDGERHYWSSNHDALPIGTMTAEVRLTNGATDTFLFEATRPGSRSTDGFSYVYNQDATENPNSNAYIAALAYPSINNATHDGTNGTLSINFTVNDAREVNGYVWFYDSSNNYVGVSRRFRDSTTGSYIANLGGTWQTTNTLSLSAEDINFEPDKSLSDVSTFHLVLLDGGQYTPEHYNYYDHRVISAVASFD